jgi:hypothetical protein
VSFILHIHSLNYCVRISPSTLSTPSLSKYKQRKLHGVDENGLSIESPVYGIINYSEWIDVTLRYLSLHYSALFLENLNLSHMLCYFLFIFPSIPLYSIQNYNRNEPHFFGVSKVHHLKCLRRTQLLKNIELNL